MVMMATPCDLEEASFYSVAAASATHRHSQPQAHTHTHRHRFRPMHPQSRVHAPPMAGGEGYGYGLRTFLLCFGA